MTTLIKSEEVSKRFFEGLGFTIRERDLDGKKSHSLEKSLETIKLYIDTNTIDDA